MLNVLLYIYKQRNLFGQVKPSYNSLCPESDGYIIQNNVHIWCMFQD